MILPYFYNIHHVIFFPSYFSVQSIEDYYLTGRKCLQRFPNLFNRSQTRLPTKISNRFQ